MLGKSGSQNQKNMFQPLLKEFINMDHELVLLGNTIQRKKWRKSFLHCIQKQEHLQSLLD
jgi:IS5 family transposase